ncbi:MAG: uracil-DNA glycosylase [Alphaproteobacteria bacterium]|jgi:DNA polymerase|nr:uracil-DNA glycosylase [Alphaproteobacteria bacterium]
MIKNLLKFYIKEGIGFSFSEKPISYLKGDKEDSPSYEIDDNSNEIKAQSKQKNSNLKSLQQRQNFATNRNIQEAEKLAIKSASVEELSNSIKSFDGCDLKVLASKPVVGDGIMSNPTVMVIGEAPSRDDDRTGIPFSGAEGTLLDKMLKSIGLSRKENAYLSNIINWWPPGNRPTTQEEIDVSIPFIKKHIELVNPKMIILLGGKTTQQILNTRDTINKTHGKEFDYKFKDADGNEKNIKCVPIFTPNFIMNNAKMKPVVWKDLLFIKDVIDELK